MSLKEMVLDPRLLVFMDYLEKAGIHLSLPNCSYQVSSHLFRLSCSKAEGDDIETRNVQVILSSSKATVVDFYQVVRYVDDINDENFSSFNREIETQHQITEFTMYDEKIISTCGTIVQSGRQSLNGDFNFSIVDFSSISDMRDSEKLKMLPENSTRKFTTQQYQGFQGSNLVDGIMEVELVNPNLDSCSKVYSIKNSFRK